jgi:hypothetical protein
MRSRIICACLCFALGGCVVNVHVPDSAARTLVGGVLVGLVIADATGSLERRDDMLGPARQPHEPDPSRSVSEQDCSRPVDPTLGNLRCR